MSANPPHGSVPVNTTLSGSVSGAAASMVSTPATTASAPAAAASAPSSLHAPASTPFAVASAPVPSASTSSMANKRSFESVRQPIAGPSTAAAATAGSGFPTPTKAPFPSVAASQSSSSSANAPSSMVKAALAGGPGSAPKPPLAATARSAAVVAADEAIARQLALDDDDDDDDDEDGDTDANGRRVRFCPTSDSADNEASRSITLAAPGSHKHPSALRPGTAAGVTAMGTGEGTHGGAAVSKDEDTDDLTFQALLETFAHMGLPQSQSAGMGATNSSGANVFGGGANRFSASTPSRGPSGGLTSGGGGLTFGAAAIQAPIYNALGEPEPCPVCGVDVEMSAFAPHVFVCLKSLDSEEARQVEEMDRKIAMELAEEEMLYLSKDNNNNNSSSAPQGMGDMVDVLPSGSNNNTGAGSASMLDSMTGSGASASASGGGSGSGLVTGNLLSEQTRIAKEYEKLKARRRARRTPCPRGSGCNETTADHYRKHSHPPAQCPICESEFEVQEVGDHVTVCLGLPDHLRIKGRKMKASDSVSAAGSLAAAAAVDGRAGGSHNRSLVGAFRDNSGDSDDDDSDSPRNKRRGRRGNCAGNDSSDSDDSGDDDDEDGAMGRHKFIAATSHNHTVRGNATGSFSGAGKGAFVGGSGSAGATPLRARSVSSTGASGATGASGTGSFGGGGAGTGLFSKSSGSKLSGKSKGGADLPRGLGADSDSDEDGDAANGGDSASRGNLDQNHSAGAGNAAGGPGLRRTASTSALMGQLSSNSTNNGLLARAGGGGELSVRQMGAMARMVLQQQQQQRSGGAGGAAGGDNELPVHSLLDAFKTLGFTKDALSKAHKDLQQQQQQQQAHQQQSSSSLSGGDAKK